LENVSRETLHPHFSITIYRCFTWNIGPIYCNIIRETFSLSFFKCETL